MEDPSRVESPLKGQDESPEPELEEKKEQTLDSEDTEEPTTKDSEESTTKDSEEPTTKDSEEPTTKDSEESTTKDSEEPTTKDSEAQEEKEIENVPPVDEKQEEQEKVVDEGKSTEEQPNQDEQEEPVIDEQDEPAPETPPPPRTKVYSIDPSDPVQLLIGEKGLPAAKPLTVGEVFRNTRDKYPEHPALVSKVDDTVVTLTYSQYYDFCVRAAKSFLKLELEPMSGVGMIGFNSAEWLIAAMGAVFAGGLAVGIYATNSSDTCKYILSNCKANVVVVEDDKQLQKILLIREQLPNLKAIVQYKGELSDQYPDVYEWSKFLELGEGIDTQVVEDKISALKPDQCCSLIYTSGTVGDPKGVMISHDAITWTCKSFEATYGCIEYAKERIVSYLPLSHIAAQLADIFIMMFFGGTTYFAQPDALKGSLLATLHEALPTLFVGVPRVWEKFMDAIKSKAPKSGVKKMLASWAKEKGLQGNKNIQTNTPVPWGWTLANKLVLKKAREALGFVHCKLMATTAAPIHNDVLEFFMSLNLPLIELYGMSEGCGPVITNLIQSGSWVVGSVGKPLVGMEVKLDFSASSIPNEGEICYHGRNVMMGYYGEEEKTKASIDPEGWMHSGDLGRIDEDGFIFVTGRIKELIITSGGENIPPVPIEDRIKSEIPFLSQAFLIGDQHNFLSCLLTLKCVVDLDTQEPTDELTPEAVQLISALGSTANKISEILDNQDRVVFTAIQEGIDRANEKAASRAQKVQKWTILDTDFSVPGGELGPTLKLRRFYIQKKFADTIDGLYAESQ